MRHRPPPFSATMDKKDMRNRITLENFTINDNLEKIKLKVVKMSLYVVL